MWCHWKPWYLLCRINSWHNDSIWCQTSWSTLAQVMTCRLFCSNPITESMLAYYWLDTKEHISMKFYLKLETFYQRKWMWKYHLESVGHFVQMPVSLWGFVLLHEGFQISPSSLWRYILQNRNIFFSCFIKTVQCIKDRKALCQIKSALLIQYGAVIIWSILTQILTKDTP